MANPQLCRTMLGPAGPPPAGRGLTDTLSIFEAIDAWRCVAARLGLSSRVVDSWPTLWATLWAAAYANRASRAKAGGAKAGGGWISAAGTAET